MPTESNSFEIILKALMDDFGGPEIFSEENEPRLTKALKSIEGLFAKEKKQLLVACMENVPQTMYSAVGLPPKEQQAKVDVCLEKLDELGVAKEVVEAILQGFIGVLKMNAKATKTPEFEKIMGEMELDGEIYKTCQIGKQIWMAENLRDKSQGITIPGNKYGRLYTYAEAQGYYDSNTSAQKKPVAAKKARAAKPAGCVDKWRLPTIEDWLKMTSYIKSLGFEAATALKSNGDWSGDADPGLDLFGFAAHPLKKWDDNFPKKEKMYPRNSIWKEENARIKNGNEYIELSKVSHFPCVQFWTATNYVDDPCIDDADMTYITTIDSAKNTIDLDNGKISGPSGLDPDLPFGFACVRFVRDAD